MADPHTSWMMARSDMYRFQNQWLTPTQRPECDLIYIVKIIEISLSTLYILNELFLQSPQNAMACYSSGMTVEFVHY